MAKIKVYLTIDRNGRVDTVSPEAAQLKPGDSVAYKLREPTGKTNWRFMGIQFEEHARYFSSVNISKGGKTLTLKERTCLTSHKPVNCTLLYTLADSTYYGPGDMEETGPLPLPIQPIHAYDPLILNR